MQHTEITAELVAEAEGLLAQGIQHAAVARRLGVTPYVVGLLAENRHRTACGKTPSRSPRRIANASRGIDAVTVRKVRRMLAAGVLRQTGIAREAGISPNMVGDVAAGRRLPFSTWRPYLQEGERFLPETIRCSVCRANICVAPCRACRTRRAAAANQKA